MSNPRCASRKKLYFAASVPAVVVLLLILNLQAQSGESAGKAEENVVVKLEQCIDKPCKRTEMISIDDGIKLETILWDKEKKQGIVVLRQHYQEPNMIRFGALHFDHVAFSPTRSMSRLYDVDRLTLWPKKGTRFIRNEKKGAYILALPRRESTLLIGSAGINAGELLRKRFVSRARAEVRAMPAQKSAVLGELKEGDEVSEIDRMDTEGASWIGISRKDKTGWVNENHLESLKIVANREVLGIALSLFGLLDHEGFPVRWRNRDYIAFEDMEPGASYTIAISNNRYRFKKTGTREIESVEWRDSYVPIDLEIVRAK